MRLPRGYRDLEKQSTQLELSPRFLSLFIVPFLDIKYRVQLKIRQCYSITSAIIPAGLPPTITFAGTSL
jgi:hypothetical protein